MGCHWPPCCQRTRLSLRHLPFACSILLRTVYYFSVLKSSHILWGIIIGLAAHCLRKVWYNVVPRNQLRDPRQHRTVALRIIIQLEQRNSQKQQRFGNGEYTCCTNNPASQTKKLRCSLCRARANSTSTSGIDERHCAPEGRRVVLYSRREYIAPEDVQGTASGTPLAWSRALGCTDIAPTG